MRKIVNLFRVRNIILLVAVGLIPYSISNFIQTSDGFNELIPHKGIVEDKSIHTEVLENKNPRTTVRIKLANDTSTYATSFQAQGAFNIIYVGDTVTLYTKKVTRKKGNRVTGGGSYWYSTDPNQVYHIVSSRFHEPVIDYKEYNNDLKLGAWLSLGLCIICFIWYFILRRSNSGPDVNISF